MDADALHEMQEQSKIISAVLRAAHKRWPRDVRFDPNLPLNLVLEREAAGNTKKASEAAAKKLMAAFNLALKMLTKAAQDEQKNPAIDKVYVVQMCLEADKAGLLDTPAIRKADRVAQKYRKELEGEDDSAFAELTPMVPNEDDDDCDCEDCKKERGET